MKLRTMSAALGTAAMLAAWGVAPPTTADVWAQNGGGNGGSANGGAGGNAGSGGAGGGGGSVGGVVSNGN